MTAHYRSVERGWGDWMNPIPFRTKPNTVRPNQSTVRPNQSTVRTNQNSARLNQNALPCVLTYFT